MDLTEDELVEAIRRVLSDEAPGVVVGIGDDAAVLAPGSGEAVLTTDMLLEGVHFDSAAISARDLGYKSIAVNVSDIAAMGASPRAAVVSLGLSEGVEASWVMELYGGMREACAEYALSLVGGDLDRAAQIVISATVLGEVAPGKAITRAGAKVGDRIVVTGELGRSATGLLLSRGLPSKPDDWLSFAAQSALLSAHARPVARVGEGQTLAQAGASAMIDISDGLARDLWRLCTAGGVGARISLHQLPVASEVVRGAAALGADAMELALSGGEDYELLATIDATRLVAAALELKERFGVTLTEIGTVVEEGLYAIDERGAKVPLEPKGWDHFAGG